MKILVLNPNTSEIVTQKVAAVIDRIKRPDTIVVTKSVPHGPVSLESFYDEALATPYSIECVKQANEEGFDAVINAAFCDPGIEALKEISDIPVYGLEECAFSAALLYGNKFGILTEKKHKESVKSREVRKHGLESRFAGVKALNMGVVEMAEQPEKVKEVGIQVAKDLIDNGADVWLWSLDLGNDRHRESAADGYLLDRQRSHQQLDRGRQSLSDRQGRTGEN